MKKLQVLLVAAMLMGTASVATAQDPQPQPQPQGGRMQSRSMQQSLMQGITLSAEQQAKIDSVAKSYETQRMAIVQDQSIEGPAKRTKIMELMGKQQEDFKCFLTGDQKTVYEKNVADMQARMQQRQQGAQRPPQS